MAGGLQAELSYGETEGSNRVSSSGESAMNSCSLGGWALVRTDSAATRGITTR
jgi:hypothetical protein